MARDQPGSRASSPGRIYVQALTEELRKYYEGHVKNLSSFRYTNYSDWLARRTFRYSILYLTLIFAALLVDHYAPWNY